MKALITGGAGFIGSHIADRLIVEGHEVIILDNLSGTEGKIPDYLNKKARFVLGELNDESLIKDLISDVDVIFHEASSVGIAQSNYEIARFTENNCAGTARLLEAIVASKKKPKLIISASNTTYGEGLYSCTCGNFHPEIRNPEDIEKFGFEPACPLCQKPGKPILTPESTSLNCNSIYALTKKFQEESAMLLGKMYGFPVVLLKYFNVFGPRQSLNNPYTGVSAIFMSRVKNNNIPRIYEDGLQTRDFIYIADVVEANILAMRSTDADYETFNVGSGRAITIRKLAEDICRLYGKEPKYEITNSYRKGDIRHCAADISKIKNKLSWSPKVSFEDGLKEVYEWSLSQESKDEFEKAHKELKEKGII